MIAAGIILLIGGFGGMFFVNSKLHNVGWLWDHSVSSYTTMTYLKYAAIAVMVLGGILLLAGIIRAATKAGTQDAQRNIAQNAAQQNIQYNGGYAYNQGNVSNGTSYHTQTANTVYCGTCGKPLAQGTRFCPNCGSALRGREQ